MMLLKPSYEAAMTIGRLKEIIRDMPDDYFLVRGASNPLFYRGDPSVEGSLEYLGYLDVSGEYADLHVIGVRYPATEEDES